jgi:DeoR/GlpR family transcriptional regulator of sugar metabolism
VPDKKNLDGHLKRVVCCVVTKAMRENNGQSPRALEERQGQILLFIKGTASIADTAVQFGVSEMTVRRVLYKLADSGQVIRTPGGAMAAPAGSVERSFPERSTKISARDCETVVLDSGTTTRFIARYLVTKRDAQGISTGWTGKNTGHRQQQDRNRRSVPVVSYGEMRPRDHR